MLRFAPSILAISVSLAASVGTGIQAGAQSTGPAKPASQTTGGATAPPPTQSSPSGQRPPKAAEPKSGQKKGRSPASKEINFNWRTSVSTNRLRLREIDDSALRKDPNLPAGWSATERMAAALEQEPSLRPSGVPASLVADLSGLDVILETKIVRSGALSADLRYRIVDARTGKTLHSGIAYGPTRGVSQAIPVSTAERLHASPPTTAGLASAGGAAAAGAAAAGAAAAGSTILGVGVSTAVIAGAASVAGTIVGIVVARKTDTGLGTAAGAGVLVSAIVLPEAIGAAVRVLRKAFRRRPKVTKARDIDDLSNLVASAWGAVAGDLAQHSEPSQPGH